MSEREATAPHPETARRPRCPERLHRHREYADQPATRGL